MAQIVPFRGYRYDQKIVGDISAVVTQPYDRIGEKEQEVYYSRSPYNIVRIIKGKPQPGDDGENVYTRAARFLAEWIDNGVLRRDPEPSFYAYHQEYGFEGERFVRKGVIALGKLEPEKVHAHERTLKGPKEDRLKLLRATEANFGHIFMLYSDPARRADGAVAAAIDRVPPTIEATDDFGNAHRVWKITDQEVILSVQNALVDKDLYIADGHHRYETAVNFMRECQKKGWRPAGLESFDHRMMTLFNIDEPGMTIRPIHRLVHGIPGFDPDGFIEKAREDFEVVEHPNRAAMEEAVGSGKTKHTFGVYTEGKFCTFTLREETLMDRLIEGRSADWKRLDVAILHAAILERLLGIDARALDEQRNITYTRDPDGAIGAVDSGKEQIFFLLKETSPQEVIRVADHGEKMPQKSTDFYPKLLTGLVITKLEIEK